MSRCSVPTRRQFQVIEQSGSNGASGRQASMGDIVSSSLNRKLASCQDGKSFVDLLKEKLERLPRKSTGAQTTELRKTDPTLKEGGV